MVRDLCNFGAQNRPKKMLYIDSQMIKRCASGNNQISKFIEVKQKSTKCQPPNSKEIDILMLFYAFLS